MSALAVAYIESSVHLYLACVFIAFRVDCVTALKKKVHITMRLCSYISGYVIVMLYTVVASG